jgi:hypothetical protein
VCELPEMPHGITIGDTIAYTSSFLDRQNVGVASAVSAQGKVVALHRLESGILLADIEWDKRGLPKRVNVKNLIRVNTNVLQE